ncbi:MAG: hypothetical protein LBE37_19270 [Sphingobacterium sp.]|jgi:hypothetical protein|nr:hypothetical protein [Sphingobacterium sp.]
MEKFPKLENNQVAVLTVDGATGHILNTSCSISIDGSGDAIFHVFVDIEAARQFVKGASLINDKIEYVVYGKNEEVLEFIEATHWK